MKKLMIGLCVLLLIGCQAGPIYYEGTGTMETKAYDIRDFEAIVLNHDYEGILTVGSDYSIRVTAPSDVFDHLMIKKEGNQLITDVVSGVVLQETPVLIEITCPDVTSVTLNNDAQLMVKETWITEDLIITTASDTGLTAVIETKSLIVSASNDSVVTLEGQSESIDVIAENDAQVNLEKLLGKTAKIHLLNDALCKVNVTGEIALTAENSPTLEIVHGVLKKVSVEEDVVIKEQ